MADDLYSLDSASLSHLSSQLQSLGYISRPLDLPQLFASTPASTSHLSSPSAILTHQSQLANEARAREQVVRCLWSMLGARMDASEGLETLAARERVGNYELERVKGMLSKEKKAREAAEKEREKETAKAKTAVASLAKEQAHHKHAREELIKARSALQMVKTQALHDQKRRETEVSATMTRLQRLTSDPTQSKFVVLNPTAVSSLTTSSARPSKSSLSSSRTPTPVSDSSVDQAEVTFLQEALDECEAERRRFESENEGLRSLVGEVGEWTDGMLELKGVKGAEQDEAAKAMEDVGDESYMIPTPHLTLTVPELASPLYNKLYQIRVGVQALVDTTEERIEAARAELEDQLETERREREEEEQRRSKAEKELEEAKQLIASSDQLVKDFASQRFLAGIGGDTAADVSADDAEEDLVRPVDSPAAAKAKVASKPEDDRAAFEAKRAKEVADFLGDLGLDSPVPAPGAKTLSSAPPAASTTSISASSNSSATTAAPRPKPSTSRPKSSSHRSKPVAHPLSPLVEEDLARVSSQGAASAFDPPSPFLSSAPAPAVSKPKEVKPRSALAGIMAMADTPPSSRDTLSSVPAPVAAPARPAASAPVPAPALKSKTSTNSLLEKSKARARDALLSREKVTRTTTKKTVTVTGSVRKTAAAKENSAPRFGVKQGPMPSVF
ncbi:hypothetical protein BCR35DRAFT_351231 [Leucosporidium creatinivorum]|uniref:Afadin and alpha-actinin-binding-domain-containing protein n=1 Tax=Leucosporidium creatinivorum TaxID=106004 RepID=A0A1Y2FX48_9BASI|nr:hypothetical protein BCR35DRAFT_351231 [Leucosporidium creatinivorum]